MAEQTFDRGGEDVGNIVALEHVNVAVPDQRLATLFYIVGLGFTRDPYLMVGDDNMWVNAGGQQFHLPNRGAHVLRGHVGVVVPDLEALKARLHRVREKLAETRFGYSAENGYVAATCPWGNTFRCYAPQARFGEMTLGVPYVEFTVRRGAAPGIARFYERAFGGRSALDAGRTRATVPAGPNQALVFRETDAVLPPYDGHHVAIYISDFSGPHRFLEERGLITEETTRFQYRFRMIVDPEGGAPLFEIEHEVRSLTHPLYGRAFVNRNPAQTLRGYVRGHDAYGS